MSKEIIKIREAIYDFMPQAWGFDIINFRYYKDYEYKKNKAEGTFRVSLLSGHKKVLYVKIIGDDLEIKEIKEKSD